MTTSKIIKNVLLYYTLLLADNKAVYSRSCSSHGSNGAASPEQRRFRLRPDDYQETSVPQLMPAADDHYFELVQELLSSPWPPPVAISYH